MIGNTHLDQPRRAIQVGDLADHMKSNYEKSSLVVCGDFNATHTNDAARALESRGLSHDKTSGPTNNDQVQNL